jgi:yecA family protein
MSPPQRDRPLNDAERDRLDAMLSRFRNESAMNNAEEVDGFFAALICSPEIAKPSQYLPEIWDRCWVSGLNRIVRIF